MNDELWQPGRYPDFAHELEKRSIKTGVQFRAMNSLCAGPLKPAMKLSGLVIASYSNPDGTSITVSAATVAAGVGKHPKLVSADRAELVRIRWLIQVGETARVEGETNTYRLAGAPYEGAYERIPAKLRPRRDGSPDRPELDPEMQQLKDEAIEARTVIRTKPKTTKPGLWRSEQIATVLRCPCLTAPERIVHTVLATEGSEVGTNIWPGIANLQLATRLSNRAVRDALVGLRQVGAIVRLYDGTKDGHGLHDEYMLTEMCPDMLEQRLAAWAAKKHGQSKAYQGHVGRHPKPQRAPHAA